MLCCLPVHCCLTLDTPLRFVVVAVVCCLFLSLLCCVAFPLIVLTLDTNLCFVVVVVVDAVVCFFRYCVVLSSCSLSFDVRL